MIDGRRRAVIYINEQEIATLLKLPKGISVMAVTSDFQRMSIMVMIEGESLEPTSPGTVLPEYLSDNGDRYNPRFREYVDGFHEGYRSASI